VWGAQGLCSTLRFGRRGGPIALTGVAGIFAGAWLSFMAGAGFLSRTRSVTTARAAIALGAGGPLPFGRNPRPPRVNTLMAELRAAAARRQAARSHSPRKSRSEGSGPCLTVSSVGKIETECETGRFLRANACGCANSWAIARGELLARTAFDITHPDEGAEARPAR